LVDGHLLLLYLPAPQRQLVLFFDDGEASPHIDRRVPSQRDEAVGGVSVVLFFLETGKSHQFVQMVHLLDLKLRYALRLKVVNFFITETAVDC
jgi:hypothetical protein